MKYFGRKIKGSGWKEKNGSRNKIEKGTTRPVMHGEYTKKKTSKRKQKNIAGVAREKHRNKKKHTENGEKG